MRILFSLYFAFLNFNLLFSQNSEVKGENQYRYSLDSLLESLDTITAFRNTEEFLAGSETIRTGKILPAYTHWKKTNRYVVWMPEATKKDKWLNIFVVDSSVYISAKLYSNRSDHLIEVEGFTGTFGFVRDISENTLINNGLRYNYLPVTNKKNRYLAVFSFEPSDYETYIDTDSREPKFKIWLLGSNTFYPITDPLMKSLLRGYDDLLEAWRANPTEENTIEILKRKHAMEPIIG